MVLAVLPRDRTISLCKVCSQQKPTHLSGLTTTLVRDSYTLSSSFYCTNKQIYHHHHFLATSTKQLPSKEHTRNPPACNPAATAREQKTQSPPFAVFIQGFSNKYTLVRARIFVPALLDQPSPGRRGLIKLIQCPNELHPDHLQAGR